MGRVRSRTTADVRRARLAVTAAWAPTQRIKWTTRRRKLIPAAAGKN